MASREASLIMSKQRSELNNEALNELFKWTHPIAELFSKEPLCTRNGVFLDEKSADYEADPEAAATIVPP